MAKTTSIRWQVAVAAFLAVAGFLAVAQLRSREPLRRATDLPSWRLQELAVLVRQQEEARERLEADVEALRRQAREYETALTEGRGLAETMVRDLQQFRLVLGLVPVEGPGVRIVVAPGEGPLGILPTDVQAQDLSGLANELWAAGAEAMALNGMRIVATTGISEVDTRIVVAGADLEPPYRLEAIGDPAALQATLTIRGGFVQGLQSVGLRVEVEKAERLVLPPRQSAEPFSHARPPNLRGSP